MLASQLAIGTLLSITVLLARANYVDEVDALCKDFDWGGKNGMPRRTGKVGPRISEARYEGIEPKEAASMTLKADCKTSRLTSCAIEDSDSNPVSADPAQGHGCSDQFKMMAKDNSLKQCRLVCPLTVSPLVACEGFVEDSVCLTASGEKSTKSNQKKTITLNKAFVGSVATDLDAGKRIEYTADCNNKEIKLCSMQVAGEPRTANAKCNPFDDGGCTAKFDMTVSGKSKRCRMCCFKSIAATITCDA